MAKLKAKTIFWEIFLIAASFAFLIAAPTGFAASTAICRHDISDPNNPAFNEYKKTVFCPTDQFTGCGDGITSASAGEACDDGNPDPKDACNACQWTYCGDGIIQTPNGTGTNGPLGDGNEECDGGAANGSPGNDCSLTCTLPLQPGDILSVKITKITNEDGTDTTLFSRANTMNVVAAATNYSAGTITGDTVFSLIKPGNVADVTIIDTKTISNDTFPPGQSPHNYSFNWATTEPAVATNGTYEVKVSVPIQLGEESFTNNNSDSYYITLGEAVNNNVSVPETSIFILPILLLIIISLITYKPKGKKAGDF